MTVLTARQIHTYATMVYDLEGVERDEAKKKSEGERRESPISKNVSYGLISHFFRIAYYEVDKLYITDYKWMLEQALNLSMLYRQEKFSLTDTTQERADFLRHADLFRKQGRL